MCIPEGERGGRHAQVYTDPAALQLPEQDVHLAIGMFDGVHRGHAAVIASARQRAAVDGGIAGVFTFWPHPSRVLRPDAPSPMIFAREARDARLLATGVAFVFEQAFTPEFAGIEAEAFVGWLVGLFPRLRSIHVGENWRFGRGRTGDATLLGKLGAEAGIAVVAVPRLPEDGEAVSSSRIRRLVAAGEMQAVERLLGAPYDCEGTVVPGRQLGRTIGFPTLNLDWRPELEPARGVYAVRVQRTDGGAVSVGVANFGLRPTVGGAAAPQLEVHLLGSCPFDAGDRLRVEWLHFLRVERRFDSIEALREQIGRDRDAAAAWFGQRADWEPRS